jgi:hypothetical protein
VTDHVVRIALEGDVRELPRHPFVERVVQEQVRQQRRDGSLNAKDNFRFERAIVGWRGQCVVDLRRKR